MAKRTRRKTRPKRLTTKAARPARTRARPLSVFHVDAFTTRVFHGNPAAVVLLDGKGGWLPDDVMQSIAAEHNLSETAFVLSGKGKGVRGLRWFTPTVEVDLCGHATLAAAHVLWNHAGVRERALKFRSRSGVLPVTREGGEKGTGGEQDRIVLDFPARPIHLPPGRPLSPRSTTALCAALGREPAEVWDGGPGRSTLAVFDNKRDVHALEPDMALLSALDTLAVIATAPGAGHDFVCRFFTPRQGIPEDPVTGSAHCTLAPYWADRLGKHHLTSHQVSRRGGELWCELSGGKGQRVLIGGHAVTFSSGEIRLKEPLA